MGSGWEVRRALITAFFFSGEGGGSGPVNWVKWTEPGGVCVDGTTMSLDDLVATSELGWGPTDTDLQNAGDRTSWLLRQRVHLPGQQSALSKQPSYLGRMMEDSEESSNERIVA